MGCGCLVLLLGTAFPRIALIFTWLFSDRVDDAFDGWALPLLGLILLPYTTFFYVIAYAPVAGVDGFGWLFVIFGFLLDLGSHFRGAGWGNRTYRERYAR
jgi:hypothetical protein